MARKVWEQLELTKELNVMSEKISWYNWLGVMFKEFLAEKANQPNYVIVDINECKKTGFIKAVIKLADRHIDPWQ